MITLEKVTKVIVAKFGYAEGLAESIAEDFIRDDFRKNKIKTMAEAEALLDYVHGKVRGN